MAVINLLHPYLNSLVWGCIFAAAGNTERRPAARVQVPPIQPTPFNWADVMDLHSSELTSLQSPKASGLALECET